MTRDAARLLEDALRLGPNERAELAEELLASLDEVEDGVEEAWAAEISKRAADARLGATDEEDWRSALADVRRDVLKR
jgi:putative addiction module component (TIGR02574 family)